MTITLAINGQDVEVPDGSSVLDAVNVSGAYVPQLCKDPDMGPNAACRTCLVEVEGARGFPASCTMPAAPGMSVRTDAPDVERVRRGVIELTMAMVDGNGSRRTTGS